MAAAGDCNDADHLGCAISLIALGHQIKGGRYEFDPDSGFKDVPDTGKSKYMAD